MKTGQAEGLVARLGINVAHGADPHIFLQQHLLKQVAAARADPNEPGANLPGISCAKPRDCDRRAQQEVPSVSLESHADNSSTA